ncbi:type II secretion system F family protein [Specibacter sp. NPDC078709]|uniref:type II secretion system F family protein n=1 Tax=Specibacter sp. NPDC078709 TaxID=3154364 RepID=UPI00341B8C1F
MGAATVFILAGAAMLVLSLTWGVGLAAKPLKSAVAARSGGGNNVGGADSRPVPGGPTGNSNSGVGKVPLLLDLLGTALESGLTIQNGLQVVAEVSGSGIREALLRVAAGLEIGASWHDAWEGNTGSSELAQLHAALSFGALTGAGAAPLLYAEAAHLRKAGGRQAEKRAAALGVKLVLPLGLCSLPAFVALGIVPVVIAMVPAF